MLTIILDFNDWIMLPFTTHTGSHVSCVHTINVLTTTNQSSYSLVTICSGLGIHALRSYKHTCVSPPRDMMSLIDQIWVWDPLRKKKMDLTDYSTR